MSAARLDLAWDTQTDSGTVTVRWASVTNTSFTRNAGARRGPVRCPECDSIIYSRRHRLCGVCSQPLPEELLFNTREAMRVEALVTAERIRHRKWMEQRAAVKST
jgi:hypothetical protein